MPISISHSGHSRLANRPLSNSRAKLGESALPWAVIDVDIADGVPHLASRDNRGQRIDGYYVVIRVFTEPLDELFVKIPEQGLSPEELGRVINMKAGDKIRQRMRTAGCEAVAADLPLGGLNALKRPEWLIGRDAIESGSITLTIAICTRDRPQQVERCLASLQAQSYIRLSVLVVDNSPTDDAVRKLVECNEFQIPVSYILEPKPGLSHARNKAVEQCETDIIAFIDDDEVACPYWASELVRGFVEDPAVDCVTGVVTPCELNTTAQQLFERFGGHSKGRGFQEFTFDGRQMGKLRPLFPLPGFGTGANMAFRTPVLRELGVFDTALGAGTAALSGEDTDIFATILLDGRRIAYRPSALVRHYHRRTKQQLYFQMYGFGVGLTAFYAAILSRHPVYAFRLLALAPRACRELFGASGQRAGGLGKTFPKDLLSATRRGMIHGPRAYWMGRLGQRRRQSTLSSAAVRCEL